MQKTFIYISIFLLWVMHVHAQQHPLFATAQSITNEMNNVISDKAISQGCKNHVRQAKKEISGIKNDKPDIKTVEQILNNGKRSVELWSGCNYPGIKKLNNNFRKFLDQLQQFKRSISAIQDPPTQGKEALSVVPVQIEVVDANSLSTHVDGILTIDTPDTRYDSRPTLHKSKDSIGYFYASLQPNKKYSVKVEAKQYKPYLLEYIPTRRDKLLIKLTNEPAAALNNKEVDRAGEREMFKSYLDRLSGKITFLFILITVVSLLLTVINLLYAYSFYKWHLKSVRKLDDNVTPSIKQQKVPGAATTEEKLPESPTQPVQVPVPAIVGSEAKPHPLSPELKPVAPERYFLSEILITAGPRKKFMEDPDSDKDLGEDVCGFITTGKQVLVWLLDGTSDLYCLKNPEDKREYFSSRLLAQSIANRLRLAFTTKGEKALDAITMEAIEEVRADWLRVIEQLPAKEKEIIKANIENKNIPECATTLLIGQLSIQGDLTVYRSGDSKMYLFKAIPDKEIQFIETTLAGKNEESNDRVFFRLLVSPTGQFDILFNQPKYEIVKQKEVSTLIAFSDGIGMTTDLVLKQQYKNNPEKVRNEIIYQSQGTADDKSICFVEIREMK